MVRIHRFNKSSAIGNPGCKTLFIVLTERTGFITYLPRHNCRIFTIFFSSIPIDTIYNVSNMIPEQMVCFFRLSILCHIIRKSIPSGYIRHRHFTMSRPIKILGISTRPLPAVIQEKYGIHIPFIQLRQEEIEPVKNSIIIHTGFHLKCRLSFRRNSIFSVCSNKNTQIVNTKSLQIIQFTK